MIRIEWIAVPPATGSRALGDRAAALRYAEQLARRAPTERGWLI